jgi:hypothetical protein
MPANPSATPASLPLVPAAQRTTPEHEAVPFRRLVGSRPLRGATRTAQRSGPAGSRPALTGLEAAGGAAESVVSRGTSGGPTSWLPSPSPSGTDAAPPEALPGFASWGPAAARSAGEGSTDAWSTLAPPTNAGANRATGPASPATTRPLAVARSTGSSSAAAPLTLATAPTVARSAASAAHAGSGQPGTGIVSAASAAPPAAPSTVLSPTATAVVQRVEGAPPAAPDNEESGEQSDNELDELARKLFGRFRNQLRYEYIYEREAKGLTFDIS